MEDNSELEQEFRKLYEEVQEQIKDKVSAAYILLDQAVQLSEKHSIPFYSNGVSGIGQDYTPRSIKTNKYYKELSAEVIDDITGLVKDSYGDWQAYGWEQSQIC